MNPLLIQSIHKSGDTLNSIQAELFSESVLDTFVQDSNMEITEQLFISNQNDWLSYALIGLFLVIAVLWYAFPERISNLFSFPSLTNQPLERENISGSPGFVVSMIFFSNYLIAMSLYVYMLIGRFTPGLKSTNPANSMYIYIAVIILILFFYRLALIKFTGFVFQTTSITKLQLSLYLNINSLIGIILLPLIVLTLYMGYNWVIYFGIFIVIGVYIFKWFQTFFLGKFIPGFSVFHLFLYLCTLEIIPLLVLIKLLKSG